MTSNTSNPYDRISRSLLDFPGYLTVAVHCLRENHRIFLLLFGFVLAPIHLIAYLRGIPTPEQLSDFAQPFYIFSTSAKLLFLVWLILLVDMAVKGQKLPPKTVLQYGISRLPHAFIAALSVAVISCAGFFFFLIPGLAALFFLQYTVLTATIRGCTGMTAARHSIHVVKFAWSHILPSTLIFIFLVPGVLMLPAKGILSLFPLGKAEFALMQGMIADLLSIPGSLLWILLYLNVESQAPSFEG